MHASARRRRGRTYVQSLCRGGVRVETDHRPGQKLTEVHVAAAYVAADEVGVLAFEIGRVEEALLGEQDKEPLRVLSPGYGSLARGDFLQRPTEVNGPGAQALLCLPGDRPVEREVDLECTGAVAVALEGPPIPLREVFAGNGEELSRRHVEEDRAGLRHLLHVIHPDARVDLAP